MKPEERLLQMIYAVQCSQSPEIERQVFDLTIDYIYERARNASQQEGLNDSKKVELVEKAESLSNLFLYLRGIFESDLSGIAKDIVYGSLAAVLVTISGIPLNVELSPALRRAAQEQQGLNAGKARLLKHVMPRQAALHAAIIAQEEESALAPSIKYAGSIIELVNERLRSSGKKAVSARTIQRAVQTILKERQESANHS